MPPGLAPTSNLVPAHERHKSSAVSVAVLLPDWDSSAEDTSPMQKFSAAAIQALTVEQCDHILASIRDGARFRVFLWGALRPSQHVLVDGDLYDGDLYLVQPSEWFVIQGLGASLRATITFVLWGSLFGILSIPLLIALPVWAMCIVHIVRLLTVNLQGGRDVTDAVIAQLRRKLDAFSDDQNARDFLDELSQRPSYGSEK